jgi:DNA-binding NtrC family response regulator
MPQAASPPRTIVARSPATTSVLGLLDRVAATDWTVLIEGETGTGKTMLAYYTHARSRRSSGPMALFDCAAVPETLLESELFGHARGAFTGADRARAGQFEQADRGTLFIDEIGNLSLAAQTRLLTVLEEGRIRRLGGREVQVDVRILAATNRCLRQLMGEGLFREDLYHRLSAFTVRVPPLRERPEDIPALWEHYIGDYFRQLGKPQPPIPGELLSLLQRYAWPGNVRELQNLCKRVALLTEDEIRTEHVLALFDEPLSLSPPRPPLVRRPGENAAQPVAREERAPAASLGAELAQRMADEGAALSDIVKRVAQVAEREIIVSTLLHTGGNKAQAARELGINYKTLYSKVRHLAIRPNEYRS